MVKVKWFLLALFSVWVVLVFYRYFSLSADPFQLLASAFLAPEKAGETDPGMFFHFGGILLSVLAVGWITFSIGDRFQSWIGGESPAFWMRIAGSFSLGIFLLSELWLGLGLVGLWFKPVMEGSLAALFLFSLSDLARISHLKFRGTSGEFSIALVVMVVIYCGFSFLHIFLPETHPDGLVYHLGTLSFWIFHHGMADLPSQPMAHFPFGGELYWLTGLILGGSEAAKGLNWLALMILGLAAGGWAEEISGIRAKWLTLGCVLTLPLLHLVVWTTQVEILQSLFLLLFFYGLSRWLEVKKTDTSWILLTGIRGGMALSIKYTSGLGVVVGMLVLALLMRKKKARFWRSWAGIFTLVLLVSGAWWLKNWVYARNPVYPYLAAWGEGRRMSQAGYQHMIREAGYGAYQGWNWWDFPWKLFVTKPSLYGFSGPLPLVLLPLVLLFSPRKRTLRFLGWVVLALWCLGLTVSGIMKFQLPTIVLTYLLIGVIVTQRDGDWSRWVTATAFLCGLFCFPYLAGMSGVYCSGGGIWSGRETPPAYLERVIKNPYESLCVFVDQNLSSDARLLIVGDARGYGYARDFYTDTGYDQPFLSKLFQRGLNLDGIRREMKKMGFTHIVTNEPQGAYQSSRFLAYPLSREQWRSLDDYWRRGLDVLYSDDSGKVYGIRNELRDGIGRGPSPLFLKGSKFPNPGILPLKLTP